MTTKILLVNSEKSFLADYTPKQPIEPIIKECYRQFKITIPEDFLLDAKLYELIDDTRVEVDTTNFNLRWGDYPFSKDAELVFEP